MSAAGASAVASAPASTRVMVPAEILDPIVADAATRATVDKTAVTVVEAAAQTWPNGALGCPSPGVMYTQAIVNGWRVVLSAGSEELDYRASGPGRFKLCTTGAPGGGSSGGSGAPG